MPIKAVYHAGTEPHIRVLLLTSTSCHPDPGVPGSSGKVRFAQASGMEPRRELFDRSRTTRVLLSLRLAHARGRVPALLTATGR